MFSLFAFLSLDSFSSETQRSPCWISSVQRCDRVCFGPLSHLCLRYGWLTFWPRLKCNRRQDMLKLNNYSPKWFKMDNVDLLNELCFFEDSSVTSRQRTGSIEKPQLTAFHTPTPPLNGPIEGELQAICLDTPSGKKPQGTWLHNQREQGCIHDLHRSFQVARLPTTGTLMSCRWGLHALWTGLRLLMASLTISNQHYFLHKLTSPGDGMTKL